MTRTFLPLIRSANGRIVNLASFSGRYASPHMSAYCASKHATVAFTDSLAYEVRQVSVIKLFEAHSIP